MSLRLSLTALVPALLLVACDSEPVPPAQQQEQLAAPKQDLVGTLDYSLAGTQLPQVTLTDPAGRTLDMHDFAGRAVLLNLWATWCAPCVVEMPTLDALAVHKGNELAVVTVSQDLTGAKVVAPFFADREFERLEPWLDPDNRLGQALGGDVLPVTILFDASGSELLRVTGGYHWDSEEAIAAVEEALAQ